MKKCYGALIVLTAFALSMSGCQKKEDQTIMVAAAASLENCLTKELIPLFEKNNPGIKVTGTYDSSGKLQTQIEEGAEADVFFSAASKQMNALVEKGMMEDGTVIDLLENKIVLIAPLADASKYQEFSDIAKVDMAAIGDPGSVPAGQYAQEVLETLGLWTKMQDKMSLGSNVTEVLNWVAEGSAELGIVYATDAAQTDKAAIVAEAPEGSCKKVIYPVGMVKTSKNQEAAKAFIAFLQTEEALTIFENNGFTPMK